MKSVLYLLMLIAICSCHSPQQQQQMENSSSNDTISQLSTKLQYGKINLVETSNVKKDVELTNDELYKCISIKIINGAFIIDSIENFARKCLKLELITKDEYNNEQKNAINFLVPDSVSFPKKYGITTLPFPSGDVQYVDVYPDEASMREYYYRGHYSNPEFYLMYVQYYEAGCSYWLLDKSDSSVKIEFPSLPYFTPDKKNIIAVAFEPYGDYNCAVKLCTVKRNSITCKFQASFINWAPSFEEQGYMSADGCFRVPIISSDVIWTPQGNFNKNYQYLKISVL